MLNKNILYSRVIDFNGRIEKQPTFLGMVLMLIAFGLCIAVFVGLFLYL